MKFKEKLSNFWYYYKWHTLIAVFFVTVISILVVQMASREDYDIKILYAGPKLVTDTQSAEICSAAEQIMTSDYNGDGKKNSVLNHLAIMTDEELEKLYEKGASAYILNPQKINENRNTLTSEAYAGEFLIFLLSEDCYIPLAKAGAFVPIDDLGIKAGERYDECAIYLNSLDVSKFFSAFGDLPDDTLLCLRKVRTTDKGNSKQEKSFEYCKEFFIAFAEFKLPEGFEP